MSVSKHKFRVPALFILILSISISLLGSPISAQTNTATGVIAYFTNQDGNWEIYTIKTDGSDPVRLTNNEFDDLQPAFSPDGLRMVFTTNRDGGDAEIYSMFADGSDPVNLTNHESGDIEASYSPSGTHIVFRSNRDGNWELYTMKTGGTELTRVTDTSEDEVDPAYSPDGTHLIFGRGAGESYEIYTTALDGSDAVALTSTGGSNVQPSYSPDGTRIVFRSNRDGNLEIYSMAADGSDAVNLSNTTAGEDVPAYSRDGARIAFRSDRDGNWEIYSMAVDGSDVVRLTTNEAEDSYPAYAPYALGTGDVQVTLSWDSKTDMDIHVTEPNGEVISYQTRQSSTGGELDVDSNVDCPESAASGVENVFWPTDAAPTGTYTVRVHQYSTCDIDYPNWTLTVRVRGAVVLQETGNSDQEFTFDV